MLTMADDSGLVDDWNNNQHSGEVGSEWIEKKCIHFFVV